jgi:hypothetical protein
MLSAICSTSTGTSLLRPRDLLRDRRILVLLSASPSTLAQAYSTGFISSLTGAFFLEAARPRDLRSVGLGSSRSGDGDSSRFTCLIRTVFAGRPREDLRVRAPIVFTLLKT